MNLRSSKEPIMALLWAIKALRGLSCWWRERFRSELTMRRAKEWRQDARECIKDWYEMTAYRCALSLHREAGGVTIWEAIEGTLRARSAVKCEW